MLVTPHLLIPGPTKVAPGSGSGAAEYGRATTKASATSRPETKLKLAS